jgi:multidrug efflux system outer membrane protein
VRAAHAVFSGTEYDYAPHVPLQAGYAGSKEQEPGFGSQRYNAESYTVGLDVAWELDLFGHVRRTVEAARGDLAAEQEDLQYARVPWPRRSRVITSPCAAPSNKSKSPTIISRTNRKPFI